MKILFSPLGMTDPIRYFRDGAMLNIIRNYQPDKVYLYMSKEICEHHHADNRYRICIEALGKRFNKIYDDTNVEVIERPEMEEVQRFDDFFEEFRDILNGIHENNPDAEILLNVSSGTPAMKSSLQILSLTLDYPCVPIQVSTPKKRSNPHVDEEQGWTPADLWEMNESNEDEDNRCVASTTKNLMIEFQKQTVKNLIQSYDYSAALQLAMSSNAFSEEVKELLAAANGRLQLKYFNAKTAFKKQNYSIELSGNKEVDELSEYLLSLKIRIQKQEYADYMRSVTPAFYSLCRLFLKRKGQDVEQYAKGNWKGVLVWDRKKMEGTDILNSLDDKYGEFKDNAPVNTDSMCTIILNLYQDDHDLAENFEDLREKVEKELRNTAAHTIASIDDKRIKADTGFSSEEIWKKLVKIYESCGYRLKTKSYDNMNDFIIRKI